MKAFKCDRCGNLYEGYTEKVKSFYINRSPVTYYPLDLCPECNKELKDWFEEKENEEIEVKE